MGTGNCLSWSSILSLEHAGFCNMPLTQRVSNDDTYNKSVPGLYFIGMIPLVAEATLKWFSHVEVKGLWHKSSVK